MNVLKEEILGLGFQKSSFIRYKRLQRMCMQFNSMNNKVLNIHFNNSSQKEFCKLYKCTATFLLQTCILCHVSAQIKYVSHTPAQTYTFGNSIGVSHPSFVL